MADEKKPEEASEKLNIIEEEKAQEKGERDYNTIFDDDYIEEPEEETEASEEQAEENQEEEVAKQSDDSGSKSDSKNSSESKSKSEKKEKAKEEPLKEAEPEKSQPPEEKAEQPKQKKKIFAAKNILIAVALIFMLILGAFFGSIFFRNKVQVKEEATTSTTTTTKPEKSVYITAQDGLNMREKPDKNAKVLAIIPYGTKLDVLEEQDGWYKVKYNGQTGWVSKDFVSETKPADMKTYTGSGFSPNGPKFSIQYPADWSISDYKISKTDNGKTYKIALGEGGHGFNEGADPAITTSSDDVTYNGLSATKMVAKNNGNIFLIVAQFKKGNDTVQIEFNVPDGYDPSYIDLFDKMLNTFKFI